VGILARTFRELNRNNPVKWGGFRIGNIMNESHTCGGRREFLVKSSAIAGGFLLSLSGVVTAEANNGDATELVVKIGAGSALSKVGGAQNFDTESGPVVVIRTGEAAFAAFSSKCTHKGGVVEYDSVSKELVCPLHGSRFASADGSVAKGPASKPIAAFTTETAIVVNLKAK
jgi:nitrite reductase/ring-hydroxylating ferredoxin subunit